MKKLYILLLFSLCSITFPVDIFNFQRSKIFKKNDTNEHQLYVKYGFGNTMLNYYNKNTNVFIINASLHALRFSMCYPFIYIALEFPKIKFIINFILLILCLILIKELNKKNKTLYWYVIPFLMFFISFRSFLPGVLLALFITRPNIFYGILALLYSCFSSAMIVLFACLFFMIMLHEKKFYAIGLCLIAAIPLFMQKGFHFGQLSNQRQKYQISNLGDSFIKTLQNNSFRWFYNFAFHRDTIITRDLYAPNYHKKCFLKFLVLLSIFCFHLLSCILLCKKKMFFTCMIYVSMLPFAFFEGVGYSACFISLFIIFIALIKNRIEILNIR